MHGAKPLFEKIERSNRRDRLFSPKDSLVLAVSGGPDSIALLYLMALLKKKYAFKISAAHVNHGLFPKESLRYIQCVREHCYKLGIPLFAKKVYLRKLAKNAKRSLEDMGRLVRYDFFDSVAKKVNAGKILTAHTQDDHCETILMRLVRGSGLRGVSGIPAKRPQGPFLLIRPLLLIEKKELLDFLKQNKIDYCVDKSNKDTQFTRNKIRHNLLPQLAAYNPQIKDVLCSLAQVCREAQGHMESEAKKVLGVLARSPKGGRVSFSAKKLRAQHPALAREIISQLILHLKKDLKRIAHSHIESVRHLLNAKEAVLTVSLPGLKVSRRRDKVTFRLVDSRFK